MTGPVGQIRNIFASTVFSRVQAVDLSQDKDDYALATILYSHADSMVMVNYCWIIGVTVQTVEVKGFMGEIGNTISVAVFNSVVVYDC